MRYYSEAHIYDGIIAMISTLRFCEEDRLEIDGDLVALNLDFLVATAQNAVSGVRLVAQNMRMANGTYAELDVGDIV